MLNKNIFLVLLLLNFVTISFGQESKNEELISIAKQILKPEFVYRYNLNSNFIKQKISERKSSFFSPINPADTALLKAKLKNDTSDAFLCFKLYELYKTFRKTKSARFYLNKSIYWYEEKIRTYDADSAASMNLAILYSANNDFEAAAAAYKRLYQNVSDKEFPSMMLAMIYMSLPDSMEYYIKRYDKTTKDDYKKMLLFTTLRSLQFLYSFDKKDSVQFQNKHYKELTEWDRIEKIYQKKKEDPEYELMYHSLRTYLIVLQATAMSEKYTAKYKEELKELEQYYFKFISNKKYPNKLVPYLSLSVIYTFQKRYEQAIAMQRKAYDFAKIYEVTDSKESEEIINSYIGLFELSKRYEEGKAFTYELIADNPYNIDYRKAFIYFSYESGNLDNVATQVAEIKKYHGEDVYPQLVEAFEALQKSDYTTMLELLKKAYSKNSSIAEIYAMMAAFDIARGKYVEAESTIKNFEEQMPNTAAKLRKLFK